MKLIFLDIDGCLNQHDLLESGYCGTNYRLVKNFNKILISIPDSKIVISSTWRYLVVEGFMTMMGFENMLLTHGIDCYSRIHGITESDAITGCELGQFAGATYANKAGFTYEQWIIFGLQARKLQIEKYLSEYQPSKFIVIDDLNLNVPNLIKCEKEKGLTIALTKKAINILKG